MFQKDRITNPLLFFIFYQFERHIKYAFYESMLVWTRNILYKMIEKIQHNLKVIQNTYLNKCRSTKIWFSLRDTYLVQLMVKTRSGIALSLTMLRCNTIIMCKILSSKRYKKPGTKPS